MFDTLKAALVATPSNTKLLMGLLKMLQDAGNLREAGELLDLARDPQAENSEERLLLARALLEANRPERALEQLTKETPEERLLAAEVHLAMNEQQAALTAYTEAITQNPTLEDLDLKARLGARVRDIGGGRRGPLRVISNDDTDATEITRLLEPNEERVTFADVGGLEHVKKQIHRKIILPFKKPSIFERFKKKAGGGILLYGPPGCGKTLLARATAGECNAQFLNVVISDILDMYIGESERKLHAIFEKARTSTPSVLFFDELEALAGKRQYTREGTSSKLVSQFLSEMDGFAKNNSGVLVLGATNVPWAIDSAFRRAGRFDRVLFVPPPDNSARAEILDGLLKDRPMAEDVQPGKLAKQTSGFSGADLRNLVETASDEAIEESLDSSDEVPISGRHLKAALQDVKATTVEWLTTARNYARYSNEAGQYDEVLAFLRKHGKG